MKLFLLLVVILSRVVMVTAVDGCHKDRDKDHRPRENCTAAGFSSIPGGFKITTKVLLFPQNLFTSLPWASFQVFTEIYEIDLTENKVPEVTPSATPLLPSLSVLRLGSNRLKSLSDGSFSACPALTELYLKNNIIQTLSDNTFSGLSKLEILDLSFNHISVLPKLMLHPLSAIETLYLEGNKIKVMPDDWFIKKPEVPYLFLSANPWACSCSLDYLHKYLNDNEFNVYVRDGPIINADVESVVCDSPPQHRNKAVISLEESDLCSPSEGLTAADVIYYATNTDETSPLTTTFTSHFPTDSTHLPTTTAIPTAPEITSSATDVATVVYHRVVTWSWYQTFTSFIEWSHHSGSAARGDGSKVGSRSSSTRTTVPPVRTLTESPAVIVTTSLTTKPSTTTPAPSTTSTASTTQNLWVDTTPFATEATTVLIPSLVTDKAVSSDSGKIKAVRAAGVFCFWLFAGCLLLCIASVACMLATVVRIVVWYRRVYKPLSLMLAMRRRGGREGVRLLTFSRKEEKEEIGGGGGVVALYRSVLYVHRAGGEAGQKEGEGGEEGNERVLVDLEPRAAGGGATREVEGERGGKEERGVYRKTMYRLLSKEEEIEGWRDVMEECRISTEDRGRKGVGKDGGMGGGGVSRKRYSVILREEREETGGGREELDWVVGGWEIKRGEGEGGRQEEEPRNSWGEWLAHYLPSMPWGVTTPPEGEATL